MQVNWQEEANEKKVRMKQTQKWLDVNKGEIPYPVLEMIISGIVLEKETIAKYERYAREDAGKERE